MKDITLIINQIKSYLRIKTDSDLADYLGTTQSNIATWKKRNTINYELIIAKCPNIDANWLITGEGEMLKDRFQHDPYSKNPELHSRLADLLNSRVINDISDLAIKLNRDHVEVAQMVAGIVYPSSDFLLDIIDAYPKINPTWLLDGRGEMLQKDESNTQVFSLRTDKPIHHQEIPLYDLEASAGLVQLFQDSNSLTPIDTISIPNLPKCDGALYVVGDSMYPLLKSGDIVMYKQVHDLLNDIFWGEMYLVHIELQGDTYTTVKYVQRSEVSTEHIKLVSYNQHHSPKDIHISKVRAAALVKASVRINSMM